MDILQQCQIWNEDDEYQKIIDALEAIPAQERTPEMDSELARAYNNLAEIGDKELFQKAISLLKPHEEYFGGDHCWNFRIGYSYYYLNQERRALHYFRKALEACPGDEDTQALMDDCEKRITLPSFEKCFRERTETAWEAFAQQEAQLRQIMNEDESHERGDELVEKCQNILNLAFDEICFEIGFNGQKHELILTPEGDKVKLFQLVYFQKHAPKEVLEHWNILVGRQPNPNIGLRSSDWEVSGDDVQLWLEGQGENSFAISAYCEKLLPLLQEGSVGLAWWMLTNLTDQVIGEIPHMRYIDDFDVLEAPKEGQPILMSQLPGKLKELGLDLSTNPEGYLETYIGYKMEPKVDPDADWRLDTIAGSTCCPAFINDYMNAENDYMDDLHADGAVAGFFCYPLDTLREGKGSDKIFNFRDKLESTLLENAGEDAITLLGGATGLYCAYVDFIAWDLKTVLTVAQSFFKNSDLPWANFHVFRRDVGTVTLYQKKDELEETLAGIDYIPYTLNNANAFYQQIEQWNDEDEYTRCIQALNTIPKELRDYRFAYALARALENYAIIGDQNKGTPNDKGDAALRRAIEVLESVREEGQNKAEWNMRMAYGYQYLYGQEEKAIPYARRWAELDPEDENALAVVQECQEEIAKRSTEELDGGPADEGETTADHKGTFCGFVLLSKEEWDKQQFIRDMKEKWGITVEEDADEDKSDDTVVFEVGDMIAAVSLMPAPIPGGEAELNAENNYMWPDAVKAAKEHSAHIMVAVLGKEENLLERGKLYTKLMAACCRQKYSSGIYTSGVVFEPRFYEDFANMMQKDVLPIFNWIWFGLYQNEGGMNAYTYGMDVFGKDEMEVLNANAHPGELRDFLASLVSYVLEKDVELQDGETIGFSAEDKHTITRSPGVSLPEEQMTLKISYAPAGDDPEEGNDDSMGMDDASYHIESIEEKELDVDPINAYNHIAIYLRWCIEHSLMGENFLAEHGEGVKQAKDLRAFIREELDGCLHTALFNQQGQAFAHYYYGENDAPYYPADIDDYALSYFGPERYHSNEFQDEAYLFIPFNEDYYQAMAKVIEKRFTNWQQQNFDQATMEPSELAQAIMEYLDCECTYFPSMKDDDPIMSAYSSARRLGVREGYIPMLIRPDETLLECLVANADLENTADCYEFDPQTVADYRKKLLSAPVRDGKAVLEELASQRKEEAQEDDLDWQEDVVGEMEGGYNISRFSSYWNSNTSMTYPLILAKIPVKRPWEVFAYLPFGNWNECPDTLELMAAAKYWFQQYGAVPAAITHDELEFDLPAPIPKEKAMEAAVEQYGLCPDMDQNFETLGTLADTLCQSNIWYFWWD